MLSDLLSIIDIEVSCQSDPTIEQRFISLVSAMRVCLARWHCLHIVNKV